MEDRSLFYKYVRIELLKDKRIKDMLKVVEDGGYGFRLNEDKTKVLLEVSAKRPASNKRVELEVDANHKHLGYELLNAMHNRRLYEPFNDKHEYKVVHITSDSPTGYVEFITATLPRAGEDVLYNPIDARNSPKLELLFNEFTNLNTVIVKHKFKSHEEFQQFYRKGYLILEDSFDYQSLENKTVRKIDDKLKLIEIGFKKLEREKQELIQQKEGLEKQFKGDSKY